MAIGYPNKFAGRCELTGTWVGKGDGWCVPSKNGKWRLLSNSALAQEGHTKSSVTSAPKHFGVTTGLSMTDCWVKMFKDNEDRVARHKTPWTDEQISQFMMAEFPQSSAESKLPPRVRMHRSAYNNGTHSFADHGVPAIKSWEYDSNGKPVKRSSRSFGTGVSETTVREIAKQEAATAAAAVLHQVSMTKQERPVVHVSFATKKVKKVDAAGKHAKFVDVLKRVEARIPVLLVGPAGSGKTHLASQVAEALDLPFSFNSMSEGVSESHLLGRMLPDANGVWQYQPSPFVKAYRDGGVHLLDEVDAAEPNLLVTINAALANGQLSLPFAQVDPIKRHEDSVIIAAANTFGNGADRQYVGRNQLDAATVDRFKMGTIEMDYDRKVEEALAAAHAGDAAAAMVTEMLNWAWSVRDAIRAAKLRRIMSTRNIVDGAKLLAVGLTLADIKTSYFTGWATDEKARIS
jgi:MoxR-like ATPase